MIEYNLRYPGMLAQILQGMVELNNLKGKRKMSNEKKIIMDTECKFFSEVKRFIYKREK